MRRRFGSSFSIVLAYCVEPILLGSDLLSGNAATRTYALVVAASSDEDVAGVDLALDVDCN